MKTEFEAKFLNIDFEFMRTKLKSLDAKLEQPMRLMKRAIIDTPELMNKDAFIRVRDEGDRITLTYKQFQSLSVDGAKEYEVEVSNFEETINILAASGLPLKSIQESKRETWTLETTEIVLDEWPWLNPYIEIEGNNEQQVKETAVKLGFNWNDAVFGDVMAAYRAQYPHLTNSDTVANIESVKFGDALPELLIDNK
jgi:adenylate cyclase class 2